MSSDLDSVATRVRHAFDDLVTDEPPLQVDPAGAIAQGRRRARHRVAMRATAVAATIATATAALATTVHHDSAPGAHGRLDAGRAVEHTVPADRAAR